MTDGYENSSVEWTLDAVSAVIKRQEREYSWDFVFLGANIDAVAVGQGMGFAADKSLTYAATGGGVASAMSSTTAYVSRKRSAPQAAPVLGFSDEDRAGARGTQR